MKYKLEVRTLIKQFCSYVERQFEVHVKSIRSENGQELKVNDYYNEKGIIHQRTCINTTQQNAVAERKHQHILNVARALNFETKLPLQF